MIDQGPRPDEPTDAPARHRMGLRQAADRDGTLGHAGQRAKPEMDSVEDEAVVDLVDHDPEIVPPGHDRHLSQLRFRHDGPGGIVRVGHEDGSGARRHGSFEVGDPGPEAVLGRRWDPDERRARGRDRGLIGQVHRLDHDDLVPRLAQRQGRGEQPILRTRHHHDVFVLRRDARASLQEMSDRGPQGRFPRNGGVMRVAGPQSRDGPLDDRLRGREVRVADTEQDHVFAAGLGLSGRGVDVPGCSSGSIETIHER